jgi:hypothetical protein
MVPTEKTLNERMTDCLDDLLTRTLHALSRDWHVPAAVATPDQMARRRYTPVAQIICRKLIKVAAQRDYDTTVQERGIKDTDLAECMRLHRDMDFKHQLEYMRQDGIIMGEEYKYGSGSRSPVNNRSSCRHIHTRSCTEWVGLKGH